jgi:hypothetical protein
VKWDVQVIDSVLRFGIGEGRLGPNHRLGEESADDLGIRGHFLQACGCALVACACVVLAPRFHSGNAYPDNGEGKALDVRLQRAQVCGGRESFGLQTSCGWSRGEAGRTCSQKRRQHVNSPVAEVDSRASCGSFIVDRRVGLDEVRDIGNVDSHLNEEQTEVLAFSIAERMLVLW